MVHCTTFWRLYRFGYDETLLQGVSGMIYGIFYKWNSESGNIKRQKVLCFFHIQMEKEKGGRYEHRTEEQYPGAGGD